jgi:hypothetical protein
VVDVNKLDVNVIVPDVVIGEPEVTVKPAFAELTATLVTVPVPGGKSAVTNERNDGCAALPVDGPANTLFADWVFKLNVNVPVVVTGDPEIV